GRAGLWTGAWSVESRPHCRTVRGDDMSQEMQAMLAGIEEAAAVVHQELPPTPQIHWPLLSARAGREVSSISTQLDSLIPASKIATLTQGMFVGAISDNFDERIEQKIFHSEIVVDNEKVAAETKAYQKIPQILSFVDESGADNMNQEIDKNYKQVKSDIVNIVDNEMKRIKNDPSLQHLVQK
ncbi:MAG TPA: hypothetical protein VLB84_07305, partial [Bacteroidia bacterium]|nr:hypothetical protein [Bacteroidia bacterium]